MSQKARTFNPIKLSAAIVLPMTAGSIGYGIYASLNPSSFTENSNSSLAFVGALVLGLFLFGIELSIASTAIYIFLALRNAGRLSRKFYSYAAPSFFLTFFSVTAIGAGIAHHYGQLTDPSISAFDFAKLTLESAYCGAILGALVLIIFMLCTRLKAPASAK